MRRGGKYLGVLPVKASCNMLEITNYVQKERKWIPALTDGIL